MNDVTTLALAKVIKDAAMKAAADNLDAGSYDVDEVLHLHGTIRKGEDKHDQIIHMRVPHWPIIGVLLSKVNDATMASVIREALAKDKEFGEAVKDEANACMRELKTDATGTVRGKVTTKLTVTEVASEVEKEDVEVVDLLPELD